MPQSEAYAAVGSVGQIVETLIARREAYGISYIQVLAPYMEAFAPIVAQLARR